jgi:hypothetical protein
MPDPWTENRKRVVLGELLAADRASKPAAAPVILTLPITTATVEAWSTLT